MGMNTLTITTKKHVLNGKNIGLEWRKKFDLDNLDLNSQIYIISFPKNVTLGQSFLHGLFDNSLIILDDEFVEKYHFNGTKTIKDSINDYCETTFTAIDKFAREGKQYKY